MVHSILGIIDVLVNDKSSSLRFPLVSLPDLPDGSVLSKDVVQLLCIDFVRQVPDKNDSVNLGRQSCLLSE